MADLEALGTPEIVEQIDYAAILSARMADMIARAPDYGLAYDVGGLESDPGVILLQEASFRETLLRDRLNNVALSRYLYFARGTEIDQHAAFYDVIRMPGESDDALKRRVWVSVAGRSTGGTEPTYRARALGASPRVADVSVYVEGTDPTVRFAVFATDNNGVADAELLATVQAAVSADSFRMINDVVEVRSAVVSVVPVTLNVWLSPSAADSVVASIRDQLPALWVAESGLGRDLTHSWLIAKGMSFPGVTRVVPAAPSADLVVAPYQAVRIGAVTVTLAGRWY